MRHAVNSPENTFVERRPDVYFKGISGLKAQDLWWFEAHVADFHTVVICVGGNDVSPHPSNPIHTPITPAETAAAISAFALNLNNPSVFICSTIQRISAIQEIKQVNSILLRTFNHRFIGLGELIKNNEVDKVDNVHYNHMTYRRVYQKVVSRL